MFNTNFNSIPELIRAFPTEQSCIEYLEDLIWSGTPVSPFDPESKVYKCKDNKYKCKNTGKYFNVRTGTMYDNTKMPLYKWFLAVWLVTTHKKGISSVQLAKDVDVTQKSAWFMLQRIRACFKIENYNELDGIVEVDETFYGGKNKNRQQQKRQKNVRAGTLQIKCQLSE
jgi:transposase-like protein